MTLPARIAHTRALLAQNPGCPYLLGLLKGLCEMAATGAA